MAGRYNYLMNARCLEGFTRYKWAKLGRVGAAQGSSAIDELGRLFTWGQNYWGQSGQGDPCYLGGNLSRPWLQDIEVATQVLPYTDFIKVCSGEVSSKPFFPIIYFPSGIRTKVWFLSSTIIYGKSFFCPLS